MKVGTPKNDHFCSKNLTIWFYNAVISMNDAEDLANNVDPDQTAPVGAV